MNRPTFDTNRRTVLRRAGAAGLAALCAEAAQAADPPPETRHIRIQDAPIACFAPLYVAEALLKAEGFTEVEYVKYPVNEGPNGLLASGRVDIVQTDTADHLMNVDGGVPVVVLGGIHSGCWELIAQKSIRSLVQLKGKTVSAPEKSSRQAFFKAMLSSVGLNPSRDVVWKNHDPAQAMALFEAGKIDAFLGFVPEPQVLRARGVGRVLLATETDRPWSQYFCCLAASSRDFVSRNPVATKRALRALLKATDLCASQPDLPAQAMQARGTWPDYEPLLQAVKEIGYRRWRELSAEDTMRFWALRLRELGIVRADPKTLLAKGCDWRFINEIKRELKA